MKTQIQTPPQAELERRLKGIGDILRESSEEIDRDFHSKRELNDTGFQPMRTDDLQRFVENITNLCIDPEESSLDMGCGNGGFALMAAAIGHTSFGIDASPYLINKARKNLTLAIERDLIDTLTPCRFAVGNMYPRDYIRAYEECARKLGDRSKETTPRDIKGNPYEELGIKISDFGIIYSFPWSEHMRFLTYFLAREARDNALLILPHEPYAMNYMYTIDEPSVELEQVGDCIWKKRLVQDEE